MGLKVDSIRCGILTCKIWVNFWNDHIFPHQEVLEDEVKANNFGYVLTTSDGEPLRTIVEDKLKHPRHEALKAKDPKLALTHDEMLSGMKSRSF